MYVIGFFGGLLFFLPVLALYFEQSLFSVKNVALIFSIEALAMAVFEIPTGSFSDIFGRKKVIMLYSILVLVALSFLSVGENIFMFVGYAIFNGLAMALSSGNDQALIYDSLKEEGKEQYYKKVIGTMYALWPLGASIGSIIGGYLAHISLKTPIVYSFIPISIAFVLSFFLKEPNCHKTEENNLFKHIGSSVKVITKSKQLLILIVGGLILMSLGESMHLLKPLFFEFKEIPLIYFGYFNALIFGLASLGFYISHSVSEKFGNKKTLIFSLLLALLFTIVATFTHKYVAAFFLAFSSIFFGIRNTVIDYLFNKNIPSSYRATINSINSFVSKIGIAIMVPFIGYFADLYNINVALMVVVGIMFVVPILFLFIKDEK